MSFAGTPLGQGRRLDHNAFHGKPTTTTTTTTTTSNSFKPPSSYSYGAPALGSRSPPKGTFSSPFSHSNSRFQQGGEGEGEEDNEETGNGNGNDDDDGALSRFARLKQQQQQQHQNHATTTATATTASSTTTTTTTIATAAHRERDFTIRPGGPKIITSPPKPEKWSVKDTSVNIATAFTQAASGGPPLPPSSSSSSFAFGDTNNSMSATSSSYTTRNHNHNSNHHHNHNWASTSRTPIHVPRSTSVEYEVAAGAGGLGAGQSAAAAGAAAGGGVGGQPKRALPAPPDKFARPTTTSAMTRKPPSKTPSIRHVPDSEGEEDTNNANARGKSPFEHSLSFAKHALGAAAYYVRHRSREPEEQQQQRFVNGNGGGDDESYDYAAEEEAYQSQKRAGAGASTTLSGTGTSGQTHRRNRMSVDNKAYKPSQESEDEDDEDDDHGWSDKKRRKRRGGGGGPAGGPLLTLPVVKADKKRRRKKGTLAGLGDGDGESGSGEEGGNTQIPTSLSRRSQELTQDSIDDSMISGEQGLTSIPEVEEDHLMLSSTSVSASQQQQPHIRSGSTRPRSRSRSRTPAPPSLYSSRFSIGGLLGQIVHLSFSLVLWVFSGVLSCLSMFTFLFGQVFGTAFYLVLRRPVGWAAGSSGSGRMIGKYALPAMGLVLAWYVVREGSYMHLLPGPKRYSAPEVAPVDISELGERLLKIERVLSELSVDAERSEDRMRRYEEMQSRLGALEGRVGSEVRRVQDGVEGRAREVGVVKRDVEILLAQVGAERRERERREEKLRVLEERIGGVEGGVRDALEQVAKKAAASTSTTTIVKTGDGQDVSSIISQLVESAMWTYARDDVAKADYALHSSGARVIPSLTSPTLELRPTTFQKKIYGLFTGTGYDVGRAPVTALHHERHNGHCWPFPGQQGQLGVVLARGTVKIDQVSVDHVSRDVAFDVSSAPKDMEVWAMVEGPENIEKYRIWEESSDPTTTTTTPYPSTLPKSPQFIRLANFTYDINAPNYVQTFPIDPVVRALGLDFGIVVLRVLSNWGQDRYTCLYRFRVHGQLADVLSPEQLDDP